MASILLPVDGSPCSQRATEYVISYLGVFKDAPDVHVLNVQHPFPGGKRVAAVLGAEKLKQHHHDEGMEAIAPARAKLDAAGVKYKHHIVVGEDAESIARFAKENGCDQIVMGTRGLGPVTNVLLGSVATKVIHLTEVPVLLIK